MTNKHRYPCPHPGCDKTFSTSSHLSRHRRSMHSNGFARFKCPKCKQAEYSRRDAFRGHLLSCLAERETAYFCAECKRAFAHRSSLLRHQRISQHKGQEQNFDEKLLAHVRQVIAQCEAETGPLPQMPRMKAVREHLARMDAVANRTPILTMALSHSSPEFSATDLSSSEPSLSPTAANSAGNSQALPDGEGIHSALIQAAMIASERDRKEEERQRQQVDFQQQQQHMAKYQALQFQFLQQQQPGQQPALIPVMPSASFGAVTPHSMMPAAFISNTTPTSIQPSLPSSSQPQPGQGVGVPMSFAAPVMSLPLSMMMAFPTPTA
eukprot:TRINITY_DN143_c0_g1_i1.p1 TRINITY_DN143_c0_g1~~TRINITY_DN143_c0_g1_i1.p1  ORF type:complete len:323 (+),score=48.35 TRINITY_DN143_c0_g1_i1:692-1660(+)